MHARCFVLPHTCFLLSACRLFISFATLHSRSRPLLSPFGPVSLGDVSMDMCIHQQYPYLSSDSCGCQSRHLSIFERIESFFRMSSSKQSAPKRVSKKLLGRTDIEKALWTLDKLTQEEARMASAQGLWAAERVNSRAKRVRGNVQCVGENVQDADERVKGADDRIRGVDDRPCLPRFRQLSVDSVRYPYACTRPFWAILTIAHPYSPLVALLPHLVLGKFGLVWFGPVWAKPETEPIGLAQTGNQTI
ncbi:hypothetical protein BC826DRAFT_975816 [Russula brevipes]|nr:hypothetical protein BC826DRAFT_975816 [Russula brevipes]